MKEATPLILAFLFNISSGEKPTDALELAVIDTSSSRTLERYYNIRLCFAKHSIYSYLHPEIPERIKEAAKILQTWYLNFDALKPGELDQVTEYIDNMNKYFTNN